MADRVLTLDELCEILTSAFRKTNASLAIESSSESDASAAELSYRIPGEPQGALHTAAFSTFFRRHRYRLSELSFSVPCRVATRHVDKKASTVLVLRAPPWWRRLGGGFDCRRIDIDVSDDGMTLSFAPGTLAQLPREGENWVLLLTPEQIAALSVQSGSAAQALAPAGSGHSIGGRIARWWHAMWSMKRG
ncbi:MAG TPA: hypothetical protein VGZ01_11600 [Trinickia sp.]|nr:hypothetical protein [Trinickia sp.]